MFVLQKYMKLSKCSLLYFVVKYLSVVNGQKNKRENCPETRAKSSFTSKFSWWICKTGVLYECETPRNFSAKLTMFLPLFSLCLTFLRQVFGFFFFFNTGKPIYGTRLGKWDLAVDVEKVEEGNRNEKVNWNRALEVHHSLWYSLWNIRDCQRRLLRFKSKLICFVTQDQ